MLKATEKLVQKAPLLYVSPSSGSFLSLNPLCLCFTLLVDFWLACFTQYISAFWHASAEKKGFLSLILSILEVVLEHHHCSIWQLMQQLFWVQNCQCKSVWDTVSISNYSATYWHFVFLHESIWIKVLPRSLWENIGATTSDTALSIVYLSA